MIQRIYLCRFNIRRVLHHCESRSSPKCDENIIKSYNHFSQMSIQTAMTKTMAQTAYLILYLVSHISDFTLHHHCRGTTPSEPYFVHLLICSNTEHKTRLIWEKVKFFKNIFYKFKSPTYSI